MPHQVISFVVLARRRHAPEHPERKVDAAPCRVWEPTSSLSNRHSTGMAHPAVIVLPERMNAVTQEKAHCRVIQPRRGNQPVPLDTGLRIIQVQITGQKILRIGVRRQRDALRRSPASAAVPASTMRPLRDYRDALSLAARFMWMATDGMMAFGTGVPS